MRISIVTGPFLPLPPFSTGAVEQLWYGLAKQFASKGHQVTVVSKWHSGQQWSDIVDGVLFIRESSYSRTDNRWINLMKDWFYSMRVLTAIPESDICVTNTFWSPVLASHFRRRVGKVVVAVHRYPKRQMWLYLNCSRLIPVSHAVADAIVRQTPRAKTLISVIPNPVCTDIFTPPTRPRDYGGQQTIVYTGRIHPEKGIHVLVKAFGRLHGTFPFLVLKLVGPSAIQEGGGGDSYVNELRSLSNGAPIEFAGPVRARDKLARILQEAHYYCYPTIASDGEAFPVAPLEAMATGLPPVVSSIDQFKDYIDDGICGVVFNHRSLDPVEDLSSALTKLCMSTGSRRSEMALAAYKRAQEFSYKRVAELYLKEFGTLLRQNVGTTNG